MTDTVIGKLRENALNKNLYTTEREKAIDTIGQIGGQEAMDALAEISGKAPFFCERERALDQIQVLTKQNRVKVIER